MPPSVNADRPVSGARRNGDRAPGKATSRARTGTAGPLDRFEALGLVREPELAIPPPLPRHNLSIAPGSSGGSFGPPVDPHKAELVPTPGTEPGTY